MPSEWGQADVPCEVTKGRLMESKRGVRGPEAGKGLGSTCRVFSAGGTPRRYRREDAQALQPQRHHGHPSDGTAGKQCLTRSRTFLR